MAEVLLRVSKLKPTMVLWQPIIKLKKLDGIHKAMEVKKVKLMGDKK